MDLLHFGNSEQPILGTYHPADFSCDRNEGIVLCYPFGQEYMRSHRAYRQLANNLSKLGYHVLRFDYRGTGDSYGDLAEVTPQQWLNDIQQAIQELTDMSGVNKISLVGLRLGALLAHRITTERGIHRLALWDPVLSGQHWIDEITSEINAVENRDFGSNFVDSDGNINFNGFEISKTFQKALLQFNPSTDSSLAQKILLAVSHETDSFQELQQHLSNHSKFTYLHEPAPHDWNYVDHVGGILLPTGLINKIVEWFK